MKKAHIPVVLALVLIGISGGCKKADSPTIPTPPGGGGGNPPPSGGYEALNVKHFLLDADGKETTSMWVMLTGEPKPPRGSTIIVGPSACPTNCFQGLSLMMGFEGTPNPSTGARFLIGFSQDGVNESQSLDSHGISGKGSWQTDPSAIRPFNAAAKYLLVRGSFNGDTNGQFGTFPGQSGLYPVLVDYK